MMYKTQNSVELVAFTFWRSLLFPFFFSAFLPFSSFLHLILLLLKPKCLMWILYRKIKLKCINFAVNKGMFYWTCFVGALLVMTLVSVSTWNRIWLWGISHCFLMSVSLMQLCLAFFFWTNLLQHWVLSMSICNVLKYVGMIFKSVL